MIVVLLGAAITLTLGQIPDSGPLRMITVKTSAFVSIPLACGVISPAVITLALVLFLGG